MYNSLFEIDPFVQLSVHLVRPSVYSELGLSCPVLSPSVSYHILLCGGPERACWAGGVAGWVPAFSPLRHLHGFSQGGDPVWTLQL